MILGIDEVGRGCWAGPLVMGAVILGDTKIDGLTDSKAISAKKRAKLAKEIHEKAAAVGLGWVEAHEIDTLGLGPALHLACRRALDMVDTLGVAYHEIIIDGTVNFLAETGKAPYVTLLKKADLLIPSVSAASIVAKEARDEFMRQQADKFPEYAFDQHVGYGTAKHRLAIDKFGPCELHRLSFGPLKKYAEPEATDNKITTKKIGDMAENVVASELESRGHEIVARNWRTKFCEIDIVSVLDDEIYFTEVKYRKNAEYGDGLDAITAKKKRQIKFAAEIFLNKYRQFSKCKVNLLAADVAGQPPEINKIVEII